MRSLPLDPAARRGGFAAAMENNGNKGLSLTGPLPLPQVPQGWRTIFIIFFSPSLPPSLSPSFSSPAAMENKGLNVFNTSCVLAKPSTGAPPLPRARGDRHRA